MAITPPQEFMSLQVEVAAVATTQMEQIWMQSQQILDSQVGMEIQPLAWRILPQEEMAEPFMIEVAPAVAAS
jgi:hypothetical protein